jgi:aryl-alcohol dehydrogenase-like predicted oxidoreductase
MKPTARTIHRAIDPGITLLDTGDFYGMGHNELLIRKALEGWCDEVLLSVKFGGGVAGRGYTVRRTSDGTRWTASALA